VVNGQSYFYVQNETISIVATQRMHGVQYNCEDDAELAYRAHEAKLNSDVNCYLAFALDALSSCSGSGG
jgi:hypothetical protein